MERPATTLGSAPSRVRRASTADSQDILSVTVSNLKLVVIVVTQDTWQGNAPKAEVGEMVVSAATTAGRPVIFLEIAGATTRADRADTADTADTADRAGVAGRVEIATTAESRGTWRETVQLDQGRTCATTAISQVTWRGNAPQAEVGGARAGATSATIATSRDILLGIAPINLS